MNDQLQRDIKYLREWIEMPDNDYRNNILVVKKKLKRILDAIR